MMNLLKESLTPNSDYNKKLRTGGIVLIRESYEKVINLLDNLIGMIDDSQGNDYDYAFRTAIESLEKQLPKKPVSVCIPRTYYEDYECYMCPTCDNETVYDVRGARVPYCPYCGQALDWWHKGETDD